jgi:hypothetical protein
MIIVLLPPTRSRRGDNGIACWRRLLISAGLAGAVGSVEAGDGAWAAEGSAARPTLAPHPLQKFFPGSICVPHCVQNIQDASPAKIGPERDLRESIQGNRHCQLKTGDLITFVSGTSYSTECSQPGIGNKLKICAVQRSHWSAVAN